MLLLLHIEQVAVIERADIEFQPGFNVLTGETGAGKSIVIDALGAVLGSRTSRDLLRTGSDRSFISAAFTQVPSTLECLIANGIEPDEDGTLLIQREIRADGKNLCRVNGRPVTVTQLREIGAELLNIHGQHDGQQLLDEQMHGLYLDRFGGLQAQLEQYQSAFASLTELRKKLQAMDMDEAEKARRIDALNFQIQELEYAELVPGEEEELQTKRNLLRNAEKYLSSLEQADLCLNGDEERSGAVGALRGAQEALNGIKTLDDELMNLFQRLEQSVCEVYDLAEIVRDRREQFDFSPEELDAVEARCDQLHRLERKYGSSVEEMIQYLERCKDERDVVETEGEQRRQLEAKRDAIYKRVLEQGKLLSELRKKAARRLEDRVQNELKDLDMPNIHFVICIDPQDPSADGCDKIRFLMSANTGENLKPIAKVASGGELSRIMLALKNVLAEQESIGTLVFDEVDTGVSGRAAQKVAEKLAQVSRHKQVLCVTHLPQLAAMADTHFSVSKKVQDGRTFTEVLLLDRDARKRELARITGGAQVTRALMESMGELLDVAEKYRSGL